MTPAAPPLPTNWNLPFQSAAGSQTSKRIAGATVPSTRQNAGTVKGVVLPGGVNGPAGTAVTAVMLVSGRARLVKVSSAHGAAAATGGMRAAIPSRATASTRRMRDLRMGIPPETTEPGTVRSRAARTEDEP